MSRCIDARLHYWSYINGRNAFNGTNEQPSGVARYSVGDNGETADKDKAGDYHGQLHPRYTRHLDISKPSCNLLLTSTRCLLNVLTRYFRRLVAVVKTAYYSGK